MDATHGGNGRFVRTLTTAQRDAESCRLRARGETYGAIASALGFRDRSGARQAVERCLAATVVEPSEELRAMQLAMLDELTVAALAVLDRRHIVVSAGRVMLVNGEPLLDDAPVLAAIDRLVRIAERRSKLCGLDAPQRHEITVGDLDAEIARLTAQLASND